MKPLGSEMPQVLVKWYAYAKWVLERVESFPKSPIQQDRLFARNLFATGPLADLTIISITYHFYGTLSKTWRPSAWN